MKLVISDPKTGKSYQVELAEDKRAFLVDKRMGDKIEGRLIGAEGYELEITGGSDGSGFPMRKDIYGSRKIKAYLTGGNGFNPKRKGERRKKMVRGNTVSLDLAQVNLKVTKVESKVGSKKLDELFGKKQEEKKE